MNSKKNKGCLIFFVLILLVVLAFFLNFYFEAQKIQEEKRAIRKTLYQQQIVHQKKIDQLCVFPTGYAPTVSGYFFKIKEYQDYMRPFAEADRKRLGANMELHPLKIDYDIKDNKCYVTGFAFHALWDGKKIIPNFDRNYPTEPSEPRTQLNIEVCYSCGKPYSLGKTSTEGKQIFGLKNYKNLYFMLDKKLLDKQGNYLSGFAEHHIFYVTNFENQGLEYHFSCLGLSLGTESFPISTEKLQERKAQHHQLGCLPTSEARFSRVMFDGGSITSDFKVHVLSDIVFFLHSLRALGVQFTTKVDKK